MCCPHHRTHHTHLHLVSPRILCMPIRVLAQPSAAAHSLSTENHYICLNLLLTAHTLHVALGWAAPPVTRAPCHDTSRAEIQLRHNPALQHTAYRKIPQYRSESAAHRAYSACRSGFGCTTRETCTMARTALQISGCRPAATAARIAQPSAGASDTLRCNCSSAVQRNTQW